ncbi:putative DNA-binding protein with PD1-like motif [Kribbella orskensis]|uniref:DNA-binding protein with PD1-like motif n=2 Tax=Kribbellaceae TaxID=2726069 RepID=A0ABY2B8Q9_9ACTN|nr:putative DNA-binding protein with PD1-like motif [Kribbella sp. VKM Ac-2500]TCO11390.1 putative DNA-binding protein with PD1-like motif [Kribbella orskensis]
MGRSFVVHFDHGEDFYSALSDFCREHDVKQGFIPMFIAGMREVELVGTCEQLEDPDAPVWSAVHLSNIEAIGAGTLAYDEESETVQPHIHVSVGLKALSATAHTSHLLAARIHFLTEMYLVEVSQPRLTRSRQKDLFDVPLLRF